MSLYLSCQTHSDGGGCCGDGDVGRVNLLLVAVDVELKGSAIVAHVDGDVSTHHQRQVYVAMTAGARYVWRHNMVLENRGLKA